MDALDPVAIERVDVLRGAAEAGRAHECAVRARQTSLRDVVPSRVVEVRGQHITSGDWIHVACHRLDAARNDGACGGEVIGSRVAPRRGELDVGQHLCTAVGADLDEQLVPVTVQQLGHREVMAGLHGRARSH